MCVLVSAWQVHGGSNKILRGALISTVSASVLFFSSLLPSLQNGSVIILIHQGVINRDCTGKGLKLATETCILWWWPTSLVAASDGDF